MSLVSGLDSCKITFEFCGLAFHEKPVGYATATTLSLDFNTDHCLGSKFTVKSIQKTNHLEREGARGLVNTNVVSAERGNSKS